MLEDKQSPVQGIIIVVLSISDFLTSTRFPWFFRRFIWLLLLLVFPSFCKGTPVKVIIQPEEAQNVLVEISYDDKDNDDIDNCEYRMLTSIK